MWTLIIITTFTPFMWGDSSTSIKEIDGFSSYELCKHANRQYRDYKNGSGYVRFDVKCLEK